MTFNGTTQRLSGALTVLVNAMNGSSPYTLYYVGICTVTSGSPRYAVSCGDSTQLRFVAHGWNSGDTAIYARRDASSFKFNNGSLALLNVAHVAAYTWDGTNINMWQNGASAISTTNAGTTVTPTDTFSIGSGYSLGSPAAFWCGSIGDVLIYTGQHSDEMRRKMETWLMNRYRLA